MKSDEYINLLQELKMDGMSRVVASPFQYKVNTIRSLLLNIRMLNGKENPVWMSQNRHINGNMIAEKVFIECEGKSGDFKGQTKSHNEMLKIVEWVEQNNLRMVVLNSGSKSFHTYIHVKDVKAKSERFNGYYQQISDGVKRMLGLKTIDMKCAEPKRLHRIPLTHKRGQGTCVPVPLDMLTDLTKIIELSEHPGIKSGVYRTKGEEVSLKALLKLTGADGLRNYRQSPHPTVTYQSPYSNNKSDFVKYLELIVKQKCVLNDLLTIHPEHEARLALMGWLNYLNFSEDEAIDLVDKLADHSKWDDRQNTEKRRYYVTHAIRRQYKPYGCKKLREKGLQCVGKQCELYR